MLQSYPETRKASDLGTAARDLGQKRDMFLAEGIDPETLPAYLSRKTTLANFDPNNIYGFAAKPAAAIAAAVPTSNNPNKCFAGNIAEFFDVNKTQYPSVAERSKLYEEFGLGPATWYTGTAEQNFKLLTEFKRRSGC